MKVISKALTLSKEEYFKKHLLIINPLLPIQMTDKEAEVIATFMLVEESIGSLAFDTSGRKIVRSLLKLSHGGLGNYIRILKNKGFILGEGEDLSILEILKPEPKMQGYQFKLSSNDIGV